MRQAVDVILIGGGVIGLASAYELAKRGLAVTILDKNSVGTESSWAGAGIIPPAATQPRTALDQLASFSYETFPAFADELLTKTGVDVGYRRTGGLEVIADEPSATELRETAHYWGELGIPHALVTGAELANLEPCLQTTSLGGFWLPGTCQVRNPWLLRALCLACAQQKVELVPNCEAVEFLTEAGRIIAIRTRDGAEWPCGAVIVTAGAWSAPLLQWAGCHLPVYPVRGEILTFQTNALLVRHVVMVGKRYLVPRTDGLVLVGSTEAEVGYNKEVTSEGLKSLREFAWELVPSLRTCPQMAAWAGLRPGNRLGSPIIGRVEHWNNLWLATGHFRQGIQLTPGTARLLADLLTEQPSFANADSFALHADRSNFRAAFVS